MSKKLKRALPCGWIAIVLIAASSVALTGCGSSSSPEAKTQTEAKKKVSFTGSAFPNVDLANTRHSGGPIDSSSVSKLKVAWTLPLTPSRTYDEYSSSPVIANGVVYAQDLLSDVRAINIENGEVLWTRKYGKRVERGPNGIVVADGRVYGATPTAAFALDQATGKQLWSVTLVRNKSEGITMAPGYKGGRVYVSTVPVASGGVGILWALDAKTGKKLWHFDTVPRGLWGNPDVNWGGGLWYAPAFDRKGSMYFGVASPGPSPGTKEAPWGSSRPGPNLYTNSIVKLDAKTGEMKWYYQLTPHDLYEWNLQGPPMLIRTGGRELVVAAGMAGIAIGLDAKTGQLVWKHLLGKHNGHDNDGLRAMRGVYPKGQSNIYLSPGNLGGVPVPMSSNGSSVFAPVLDHPIVTKKGIELRGFSAYYEGELVALNARSGTVDWKHDFPSPYFPSYGATTVTNDLVFAVTIAGVLYAFETESGKLAWKTALPAGSNSGVTVAGDFLLAPAGVAVYGNDRPKLIAFRLSR